MVEITYVNEETGKKSGKLQNKDKLQIMFDSVKVMEPRAITPKGKDPVVITDRLLGVKCEKEGEVTIQLTPGQFKSIENSGKNGSLQGHFLLGEEYPNKFREGTMNVGARIE